MLLDVWRGVYRSLQRQRMNGCIVGVSGRPLGFTANHLAQLASGEARAFGCIASCMCAKNDSIRLLVRKKVVGVFERLKSWLLDFVRLTWMFGVDGQR